MRIAGYLVRGHCLSEALLLFMIRSILWQRVYWTSALMLIGACVFWSGGLWAGSPAVKTQLVQEIKSKGLKKSTEKREKERELRPRRNEPVILMTEICKGGDLDLRIAF